MDRRHARAPKEPFNSCAERVPWTLDVSIKVEVIIKSSEM